MSIEKPAQKKQKMTYMCSGIAEAILNEDGEIFLMDSDRHHWPGDANRVGRNNGGRKASTPTPSKSTLQGKARASRRVVHATGRVHSRAVERMAPRFSLTQTRRLML